MNKNAIIGQSGGPTSAINSSLAGAFCQAEELGINHIYGMINGIEGLIQNRVIDLKNVICGKPQVELLKRTPSSFLGSCRKKLCESEQNDSDYIAIFKRLKELNIGYFFYIGGNDSMDTIDKLHRYSLKSKSDIKFIGIPKTIDNDLCITDHCPGYGSAAKYIATSMKELILDSTVYNKSSVTVVEIMGRHTGWLTASSALSKSAECPGPDMICLPEVVFDTDIFIKKISSLLSNKKSLVIAVSEGIKNKDGQFICELANKNTKVDNFGHKYLCGTAEYLANLLSDNLDIKTRYVEFSTLQRCASHISSLTDINEAFDTGAFAVKAALDGNTGKVVIIQRDTDLPYSSHPSISDVSMIANKEKFVPDDFISDDKYGVTSDFSKYALPLIYGELAPVFINGIPEHLVIQNRK